MVEFQLYHPCGSLISYLIAHVNYFIFLAHLGLRPSGLLHSVVVRRMSVRPSVRPSVCLSVCLSVCPSVRQFGLSGKFSTPFDESFWILVGTCIYQRHICTQKSGSIQSKMAERRPSLFVKIALISRFLKFSREILKRLQRIVLIFSMQLYLLKTHLHPKIWVDPI